jgi:multidrug resistance efflux pump
MNEQRHDPVYRAALDSAHAELGQLAETLKRIRARQEQIGAAIESLKCLVSSPALVVDTTRSTPAGRPVYKMGTQNPQPKTAERVQALA